MFKNIIVTDKIDNKRSNRLTEIRLKFNKLIKDVNSAVFAIINEILTDKKWDRIEKENFEIFEHFYNLKNA